MNLASCALRRSRSSARSRCSWAFGTLGCSRRRAASGSSACRAASALWMLSSRRATWSWPTRAVISAAAGSVGQGRAGREGTGDEQGKWVAGKQRSWPLGGQHRPSNSRKCHWKCKLNSQALQAQQGGRAPDCGRCSTCARGVLPQRCRQVSRVQQRPPLHFAQLLGLQHSNAAGGRTQGRGEVNSLCKHCLVGSTAR